MLRVVVTSNNVLKVSAVESSFKKVFGDVQVRGILVSSGVNEQPVGDEVLIGARRRLKNALLHDVLCDFVVSIESGLFLERGCWFDKAVILVYDCRQKKQEVTWSKTVEFPSVFVEKAKKIGFGRITVGDVLVREGVVKSSSDPHVCLVNISREVLLEEALTVLLQKGRVL